MLHGRVFLSRTIFGFNKFQNTSSATSCAKPSWLNRKCFYASNLFNNFISCSASYSYMNSLCKNLKQVRNFMVHRQIEPRLWFRWPQKPLTMKSNLARSAKDPKPSPKRFAKRLRQLLISQSTAWIIDEWNHVQWTCFNDQASFNSLLDAFWKTVSSWKGISTIASTAFNSVGHLLNKIL